VIERAERLPESTSFASQSHAATPTPQRQGEAEGLRLGDDGLAKQVPRPLLGGGEGQEFGGGAARGHEVNDAGPAHHQGAGLGEDHGAEPVELRDGPVFLMNTPSSAPPHIETHAPTPPSDEDVAHVLATLRARVGHLLARRHLEPADDTAPADPLAEVSPVLASLVGASVQGGVALGPRAGARVRRLGHEPDPGHVTARGPRQAQLDGFELQANVWAP